MGELVDDANIRCWFKGILPVGEALIRELGVSFGVALAHQSKGIFVKTHPEMQTMLLYPIVLTPSRCTFAPQSPAHLIDRNLVAAVMFRAGELKSRGKRSTATPNYRNFGLLVRFDLSPS